MQATTLPDKAPSTIGLHAPATARSGILWSHPTLETHLDGPSHRATVQVLLGPAPLNRPVRPDTALAGGVRAVRVEPIGSRLYLLKARGSLDQGEGPTPLGWIQLVNARDAEGNPLPGGGPPITFPDWNDPAATSRTTVPEFLDAPTRPTERAMVWEADLFLCALEATPRLGREASPRVEPLVGVRWGFRVDTDGADPSPLPPRWTGDWAWVSWVPVLRKSFPSWQFAERTPSVRWRDRREA